MGNESEKTSANSSILKCICVVVPVVTLLAAHWFPWYKVRHKELNRLEAYAIGTTAIVGTAGVAIALSNGTRDDHVAMLGLATASAGAATIAAYAVDDSVRKAGKIANLEAQLESIKSHGDL